MYHVLRLNMQNVKMTMSIERNMENRTRVAIERSRSYGDNDLNSITHSLVRKDFTYLSYFSKCEMNLGLCI